MVPSLDEVERRFRIADMMLSMHSALRDRYALWAAILDLFIFAGSTAITATVLLDPSILGYLRVSDAEARLFLAVVSVVLFFLSILALRVDWKEKAGNHQRACAVLGELKAIGRLARNGSSAEAIADYLRHYDASVMGLEPVPERDFLRLKAKHRRKIAVSKDIDRFPGAPVWLLQLRLFVADCLSVFRARQGVEAESNELDEQPGDHQSA